MSTRGLIEGLLDLPAEIRDLIYEYAVYKPKNTITVLWHYSSFFTSSPISAAQPAVSRVNHQLRGETLPIFYRINTFLADLSDPSDLDTAKRWLQCVGDESLRHLRWLELVGCTMVKFGHRMSRLWLRVVFDLKYGTLEVSGNDLKVDAHSHVVKDAKALEEAFRSLVAARQGAGFDEASLSVLMEGFYELCVSS